MTELNKAKKRYSKVMEKLDKYNEEAFKLEKEMAYLSLRAKKENSNEKK